MTILLENETDLDCGLNYDGIANEVVSAALDYIGCPYECQINILLTDNAGIQKVNQAMRGMDMPTDVLSFPMIEFAGEADFSIVEENVSAYFDVKSGELLLGDILISLERMISQAEEYNHSIKREYAFLIAHSVLHLSGYDHMDEGERSHMEAIQEAVLQSIGYTRDVE